MEFFKDGANYSAKLLWGNLVVEKDGTVTNIQLEKKLGYGFDEEVMRIFRRMPKWKPAIRKGRKVRTNFSLIISCMGVTED